MSRKAQMTFFMLLGIIILAAFLFINYMSEMAITEQLPADAAAMRNQVLQSGSLKVLITTCLDEASKDGIELVGLQGGNIYSHQGGLSSSAVKALPTGCPTGYVGCRVGYGIEMPPLIEGSPYPPPPGYPGKRQIPYLNFTLWGRFGKYTLRPLCDTQGANAPWAVTGNQSIIIGGITLLPSFTPICLNNMYADNRSTQVQLEHFIKKHLDACVNWSDFNLRTGYNITPGNSEVVVRYGPSNLYISTKYPLIIGVGTGTPVYTNAEFMVVEPIRLKTIAELAGLMSTYDSYKLLFNISVDYFLLGGWDSFINVTVETPYRNLDNFDDFITIEDRASQLEGKNYIYRFVRENRIPALDYIGEITIYGKDYDIVALENQTIVIDPYGYDPDEDNVSYFYFGWKATYDEEFDFEQGKVVSISGVPRNWTTSEAYLNTSRNATYATSHLDIGAHNISVYACDEFLMPPLHNPWAVQYPDDILRPTETGGFTFDSIVAQLADFGKNPLCDMQIVRVFIFDVPVLNATTDNLYDDIPNEFASLEDPYLLDARGTYSVFTPFSNMIWSDTLEPFDIYQPYDPLVPVESQLLPVQVFDIATIRWHDLPPPPTRNDDRIFVVDGMHEINFTVDVPTAPIISLPVNVSECLPHRNPDNPFPYPYHNYYVEGDNLLKYGSCDPLVDLDCDNNHFLNGTMAVFQADHACCDDGGVSMFDVDDPSTDQVTVIHNLDSDDLTITVTSKLTGLELTKITHYNIMTNKVLELVPPGVILPVDDINTFNISFPFGPVTGPVRVHVKRNTASGTWGKFLSGNVCFEKPVQFANYFKMLSAGSAEELAIPWYTDISTTKQIFTGAGMIDMIAVLTTAQPYLNDFFNITERRLCGGTVKRGNMCAGDFEQILERVVNCPDALFTEGEVETCIGAKDVGPFGSTSYETILAAVGGDGVAAFCQDFGYLESFEKHHGLDRVYGPSPRGNAKGICNDHKKCSSATVYNDDDGIFLAMGGTCGAGECKTPVFGTPDNPRQNSIPQDCCGYWDGRDNPDAAGDFYCEETSVPPGPWGSGESKFKSYAYVCEEQSNHFLDDGCGSAGLVTLDKMDIEAMTHGSKASLANACSPDLGAVEAGESGVGDYCDEGSFGDIGCTYTPGEVSICGDQKWEVLSKNIIASKSYCCDGRDGSGTEFTHADLAPHSVGPGADNIYEECVGSGPGEKCIDTISPRNVAGGKISISGEKDNPPLESRCWDRMDNDCDVLTDHLDKDCGGVTSQDPDHDEEVICGTAASTSALNANCDAGSATGYGLQCEGSTSSDNYGFCVCPKSTTSSTSPASMPVTSGDFNVCIADKLTIGGVVARDRYFTVPSGVSSIAFTVTDYGSESTSCTTDIFLRFGGETYTSSMTQSTSVGVSSGDVINFQTNRPNACLITLQLNH